MIANRQQPPDRLPEKSVEPLILDKSATTVFEISEDHIVSLLMARRGRESIFGRDLFSDPAWDILLELYAAQLGNREISPADIVTAIGTPPFTATRWISALENRGFLTVRHSADGVQLRLTPAGLAGMTRLASKWGSAFVSI